jgi:carboxypeptidase C (cathepsin A)
MANFDLSNAFALNNDEIVDATPFVSALLSRGVSVLVYAGAYDLACG